MNPAPKDLKQNLAYRKAIAERARGDVAFQRAVKARCAKDPIYWVSSSLWTFNPKSHPKNPVRPFILWDFQEAALKKLMDAIGEHDLIFKKSRDMGATTLILAAFMHHWQFFNYQTFLLVSRNQDAVDKKNDPDSIFWKLDFMYDHQPKWLRPARERQSLSTLCIDSNSSMLGASTTGDAGRGGRKTAIDLDEFAAVDEGYAMLSATRDATDSRIINSTPKGGAGAYADQLMKYERDHPDWVVTLHWSQHPTKRIGLYRATVGVSLDDVKIEILDKEYHDAHPGYKFVTSGPFFWNGELRSVWYDGECDRAASPQEIAQELDMKMQESAAQYFDASVLARLRQKHSRQPDIRGEIVWKDDDWTTARFDPTPNGRVLLWCKPDGKGKITWNDIVIGCDVATGKGGDMSSNSVASIVRSSTGEKIGEFTVNTMSAHEFCEYVIAMCHWLNNAFLIWEDHGPGGEFTRRLRSDNSYSNVYRRDTNDKSMGREKTKKLGWSPTPQSKRELLADYRNALAIGKFINHCDAALAECGEYEVLPTGEIQHSKALSAQDPNARGKNHGDRVIADALSWRAMTDFTTMELIEKKAGPPAPPPNSMAGRRAARLRDTRDRRSWGSWKRTG